MPDLQIADVQLPDIPIPDIGIPKGALIIIAVIAVVFIIFKIFGLSLKLFAKFAINALIGAVLLFVCNYLFESVLHLEHLSVPITLVTAAITGVLGVPGVILIILYRLFIH